MVGLGWWFGFLESPYERDCYLAVPLESQTTNPYQQWTISWHKVCGQFWRWNKIHGTFRLWGQTCFQQKVRCSQKFSSSCWINFNKPANKHDKTVLEVGLVATKKRSNPPMKTNEYPLKIDGLIRSLLSPQKDMRRSQRNSGGFCWGNPKIRKKLVEKSFPKNLVENQGFVGSTITKDFFWDAQHSDCLLLNRVGMLAWLHMVFFATFATFFF